MNVVLVMVAFALFVSVTCDDTTLCEKQSYEACPTVRRSSLPENKEEFKQFCSSIVSMFSCLLDYAKKCPSLDEEYDTNWGVERYEKTLKTVHNFCDEESELHKAVAEHISCLHDVVRDFKDVCSNLTNELVVAAEYKHGVTEYRQLKFFCLRNVLYTSCMILELREQCGADAEKTFTDSFDAVKEELGGCPEKALRKVPEMVQDLEMEERMKIKAQRIVEILQLREPKEYEYDY